MLVICNTTVRVKQGFDFASRHATATGAGWSGMISYSCVYLFTRHAYSCTAVDLPGQLYLDTAVCTHSCIRILQL